MARFDYHLGALEHGFTRDVQADVLGDLNTRVVVPLMPAHAPGVPTPARHLNPVFDLDGERYVMATQFLTAVPRKDLGPPIGSLHQHDAAIMQALDFLLTGV